MTNTQLTPNTLLNTLKTDDLLYQEVLDFLGRLRSMSNSYYTSQDHLVILDHFQKTSDIPKLFLINYLQNEGKGNFLFRFGYSNKTLVISMLTNIYSKYPSLKDIDLIHYIPDADLKSLVNPNMFTKERKRRNEAAFNDSAKTLSLDMFSFKIFQNFLQTLPKKLTGLDASRYLKKIPRITSSSPDSEVEVASMYVTLIWDNTKTKSLTLIKTVNALSSNLDASIMPYAYINNTKVLATEKWNTEASITYYAIKGLARELGIALDIDLLCITDSIVSDITSSAPRTSALKSSDMVFMIDALTVLYAKLSHNHLGCPYYQILIDSILIELEKDCNKEELKKVMYGKRNVLDARTKIQSTLETMVNGNA